MSLLTGLNASHHHHGAGHSPSPLEHAADLPARPQWTPPGRSGRHREGTAVPARDRDAFLPPPPPTPSPRPKDGAAVGHAHDESRAGTSACGVLSLAETQSGAYEHAHVSELEGAVQAWRERALAAALRSAGEACGASWTGAGQPVTEEAVSAEAQATDRESSFLAEARVTALEHENARLRQLAEESAHLHDVLQHALQASSQRTQELEDELHAAGAYIDELERMPTTRLPSGAASAALPLPPSGVALPDEARSGAESGATSLVSTTEWQALAQITCATAEACAALQQQCVALVASFSARGPVAPLTERSFAGLDCRPCATLTRLACAEAEATVEDGVGPLFAQHWDHLRRSLEVSVEAVRASARVHQTREHAICALEALCEKQKHELQAAATSTRELGRLESLVAEQAARLASLRRTKGELLESNRQLRVQQRQTDGMPEPDAWYTTRARLEAVIQSQQSRLAELEALASAPPAHKDDRRESAAPDATSRRPQPTSSSAASLSVRRPLQTPALSQAPLSVVDAVYTAALDTAETPPRSPPSSRALAARHSPGQAAQRAAAVATVAQLLYDEDEEEKNGGLSRAAPPAWARVRGSRQCQEADWSSHTAEVSTASALAEAMYTRAKRWEGAPSTAALTSAVRGGREEENGVVRSPSASHSPARSGAFDSWQGRFRAIMETSLDDV